MGLVAVSAMVRRSRYKGSLSTNQSITVSVAVPMWLCIRRWCAMKTTKCGRQAFPRPLGAGFVAGYQMYARQWDLTGCGLGYCKLLDDLLVDEPVFSRALFAWWYADGPISALQSAYCRSFELNQRKKIPIIAIGLVYYWSL